MKSWLRSVASAIAPSAHGFVVHLNIVLYATAHWLCVPVMPFLTKKLGADPVMFGYLQTFAGFAQLIGGPFLGESRGYTLDLNLILPFISQLVLFSRLDCRCVWSTIGFEHKSDCGRA
jgi:hypothetical protein